ncbi:aminopeptidase N C-terminal domain-containing protein [Candidatus Woesearchaeota archaeon]|nr:aminopeptidase N C-terminal domain-containing protein [Candidatus Woesearchaeota archaeon]
MPTPTEPSTKAVASEREFKYYPDDFGKLPVHVEHFNLFFDVFDDHSVVSSDMTMTVTADSLHTFALDAKNLEILEVALYDAVKGKSAHQKTVGKKALKYHYDQEADKLHVTLPEPFKKGTAFTLFTKTITKPTKNVLEGLYYDETPEGCPPTQITQCQQWGFQRLVPCFDDMTAKCTYTTTIVADSRYTNVISNGDLAPEYHSKEGVVQRKDAGQGRSMLCYYNHTTPMAPYLFFLCVGTYSTFKKEFEYPQGKTFMIELLTPLNADKEAASHALEILSHGIMWIHLHTGAHKYDAEDVKKKIWELVKKRDLLKNAKGKEKELAAVRDALKELVKPLKLGYVYTGEVYREIGMQNSNFGGMENVGNTTIVTNRIMPFKQISDDSFEYMLDVKCHEFYHNLNGSEVTGVDPFVLWLNEAVTVHIETEYNASIMGDAYNRINRVMTLHAPMFGTFAEDSSPAAMPIIPKGFNTPDELITGMTYVKAPEFVKMIEILMGKEKFVQALALYHKRFTHGNANTNDWLAAMEEVSGLSFQEMAKGWLYRIGFPRLFVKSAYASGKLTLTVSQKGFDAEGPWQFPFVFCPVDAQGKDMLSTQIYWVKKEKETISVSLSEKPAYVSVNRNHTLYGTVSFEQSDEQRSLQALTDSDPVNRYMAFSEILDNEKVKLVKDISASVSEQFLSLYGKILVDTSLTPEVKAQFLSITESVRDDSVNHKYKEIYAAKEKLRKAVAVRYKKELLRLYEKLAAEKFTETYIEQQLAGMKNRDLKLLCLGVLASFDNEEVWKMMKDLLKTASHATDKNAAMSLYINSHAPDKHKSLMEFKKEAEQHLVSWENFLRIVGSNNSADAVTLIKEIKKDKKFRIEQSNDQRGLYLSFAANRKKSLFDDLPYFVEIIIRISKLNEYTGFHFLSAFTDLEKMDLADQVRLVDALQMVRKELNKKEHPSVYNNIDRILKGCPKAVKAWKEKK